MKDVSAVTRVNPDRRVQSILQFRSRLYGNEKVPSQVFNFFFFFTFQCLDAVACLFWHRSQSNQYFRLQIRNELDSWGLAFADKLVSCNARIIPPQKIIQNREYVSQDGDWSRDIISKPFQFYLLHNLCTTQFNERIESRMKYRPGVEDFFFSSSCSYCY